MKRLFYCLLLLCAGVTATATAASCPQTNKDHEWSADCFESTANGRRVKAEYLRNMRPKKSGVDVIAIKQPRELLAVDRRGRVLISHINHTGDFDYPTAPDNMGRFGVASRDASGKPVFKCGYFDTARFKVVIPAQYDHCRSFQNHEARVCNDCIEYCTESECQNSVFLGGTGFTLNRHNKVISSGPQRTLDSICGGKATVDNTQGTTPHLWCGKPPERS